MGTTTKNNGSKPAHATAHSRPTASATTARAKVTKGRKQEGPRAAPRERQRSEGAHPNAQSIVAAVWPNKKKAREFCGKCGVYYSAPVRRTREIPSAVLGRRGPPALRRQRRQAPGADSLTCRFARTGSSAALTQSHAHTHNTGRETLPMLQQPQSKQPQASLRILHP